MTLSFVVCTYNNAYYLKFTLESVATQTDKDFELIVVDDGSTDDTKRVVDSVAARVQNLRYVAKPHSGLADARNVGVRSAAGEYVGFLDADDLWSPRYVEAVRRELGRCPHIELLSCNGIRVNADGEILSPLFPPDAPAVCRPLTTTQELFEFLPKIGGGALVLSRKLYDRVGDFRGYPKAWEDWGWVIRAIRSGAFCSFIPEPLWIYRHHPGNLTSRVDDRIQGWLLTYDDLWGDADDEVARERAWQLVAPSLVPLIARYPAARARELLRHAMHSFGHRLVLGSTVALTYVGLCDLARAAATARRFLRRYRPHGQAPSHRLNLTAPPQVLFEQLPTSMFQSKR